MRMGFYVHVCACIVQVPKEARRGCQIPEARVVGSCEPLDIGSDFSAL